jgi:Fe-S cluster assembly iron-binding protein IscA
MITITESARELVGAVEHPPDKVLRLEPVEPQKLGLVIGEPEPDDQVVERQGVDLLHIPAKISEMLDGAVLDSVPTADGMALTINPPASGGGPQQDPADNSH